MAKAIFRDAYQAVKFSYLIQSYETGAQSAMAIVLRKALEESGIKEGTREPSSINFDGLNALEVRGQCSLIRGIIHDQLPQPEAQAIKSIFGHTQVITKPNEPKKYTFAKERQDAILALVQYLKINCNLSTTAILWLTVRACAERKEIRSTFQQISEITGTPISTLAVAYKPLQANIKRLEIMGMSRLEVIFKSEGIIPSDKCE